MTIFLLHILLTLAWLLLTGDASLVNFCIGLLMSLLVIWFVYPWGAGRAYLNRVMGIPGFFLFFLYIFTLRLFFLNYYFCRNTLLYTIYY